MGWVQYLTGRSVWCRLASISVRVGAGRGKCIAWPRCGSAWPDPASRRAGQLSGRLSPGVTPLYTSLLSCVRWAFAKTKSSTKHILLNSKEYNITFLFQLIYRENMVTGDNCDIIVKCFLAKIAGTEMTEHPCLYLWWDSSGSVSTLLTSWKSQFTIYNLHYLGLVYICQSRPAIR